MSLTGKQSLTTQSPLTNDGFWPDLSIGDLMDNYRIPSEYADGVINMGLTLAMIQANEKLAEIKQTIIDLGYSSLADYSTANSQLINDEEILLIHYKHAVFSRAKAGLLKQFVSMNRKPNAENMAKESDQTEMHWLDQSASSIKSLTNIFLPLKPTFSRSNLYVAAL